MAQLDHYPKKGRVYRFRNLLFWAQGGCICLEDTATSEGSFNVIKRTEFAARVIAIQKSVEAGHFNYASEREQAINFVINGCASIKEGRHQGDPFDPKVLSQQLRDRQTNKGYIYLGDGTKVSVAGDSSPGENPPGKDYVVGPGQKVKLHTHTSKDVPERVANLSPIGGADFANKPANFADKLKGS